MCVTFQSSGNAIEYYFRNTIGVTNNLDPDLAGRFVGHDVGPKYLEKLPANETQINHEGQIKNKPLRPN